MRRTVVAILDLLPLPILIRLSGPIMSVIICSTHWVTLPRIHGRAYSFGISTLEAPYSLLVKLTLFGMQYRLQSTKAQNGYCPFE